MLLEPVGPDAMVTWLVLLKVPLTKPGSVVVQETLLIGIVFAPEVKSPPAMTVKVPLLAFVR